MKSYKLIKQYPGSPEIGTRILPKADFNNANTNNYCWGNDWFNPKDFCEFWEEVVEKDYEILSQTPSIKVCDTIDSCYVIRSTTPEILSVKRLSDREVFTVGDSFDAGIGTRTIRSFEIDSDRILVIKHEHGCITSGFEGSFKEAKKKSRAIFLTHDGKDIFRGDTVWYVNKKSLYCSYFVSVVGLKFHSDINAHFLTKELAEDYILRNTPAISINEFWEILSMSGSNKTKIRVLEELVKIRL
jgi:hypothetical protein